MKLLFSEIDPKIAAPFIAKFEGCELDAYKCPAGVWTIGYGHTKGVYEGMKISQMEANALLAEDLVKFASELIPLVTAKVTENQYIALMSFAYNVGTTNFRSSSVLRNLNKGAITAAANAFLLWNKAGGKVLAGLNKRRNAERKLFLQN